MSEKGKEVIRSVIATNGRSISNSLADPLLNTGSAADFDRVFSRFPEKLNGLEYIERTVRVYQKSLLRALQMSPEENERYLNLIRSRQDVFAEQNSNTSLSGPDVRAAIHKNGLRELYVEAVESLGKHSDDVEKASFIEAFMLHNGTNLLVEGIPFSDRDPRWNLALAGHTVGVNDYSALAHFYVSHFWGRYLSVITPKNVSPEMQDILAVKDSIHALISYGLRLQIAEGIADFEMAEIWSKSRPNGVQWAINRENGEYMYPNKKQRVFNEFFSGAQSENQYNQARLSVLFARILEESSDSSESLAENTYDLRPFGITINEDRLALISIVRERDKITVKMLLEQEKTSSSSPREEHYHEFTIVQGSSNEYLIKGIRTDVESALTLTEVGFLKWYMPSLLRVLANNFKAPISFSHIIVSNDLTAETSVIEGLQEEGFNIKNMALGEFKIAIARWPRR